MKKLLNIQLLANPKLPGGTHELRERYADTIVKLIRAKLNLRQFAGREYEGSPKAGAVKIPVRDTEVTVGDYNVKDGLALSQSATTYLDVLIDKHYAVNELIDGFEAEAVPDNLVAQRLDSAAYSLAKKLESDFITEITTEANVTKVVTGAITKDNAYDTVLSGIDQLLELGIDASTIKCAVTHSVKKSLLSDVAFANSASVLGNEKKATGVVGMLNGVEVIPSALLPAGVNFVVFSSDFAQVGDEFVINPGIFDLRDGAHIGASALQGRYDGFAKVTNAKGVILGSTT